MSLRLPDFALRLILTLPALVLAMQAGAQSLGDPIVDITFGSGTATRSGPLPADSGSTSYVYSSSGFPSDDYYTIANTTSGMFNGWWTTTDHTGNTGGYMMIVNGSYDPGIFYTRKVAGLCGNTTYQFAAWIKNLLNYNGILPNVTFSIETTAGVVLGTGNTGDIAMANTWKQYPFTFTTPANTDTIVLKMTNNAPGGIGNDIAIDDITFRPYGSQVSVAFASGTSQAYCAGTSETIKITVTSTLASGYEQKLQEYINSAWTDESTAGIATGFTVKTSTIAGTYKYRVVTGLTGNINSSECVVASNELIITVNPLPVATAASNSPVCAGNTLTLQASGGATYSWTGPNGFKSTEQNPTIGDMVTADAGDYTVVVTSGSCSSSATTTVNVYNIPVANAGSNITICEGDNTTLTAGGGTNYRWSPATGLSDTTIANPIASPTDTTTYTVTVSNSSACTSTASVTVNVLQKPEASAGPDKEITQGQSVTLNGKAKGSAVKYYWTPNEYLSSDTALSPVATPPADITYTLHVTSAAGCGAEATSGVFVRVYKSITIPNTFTPNGDGVNDTWNITALDTYANASTQIFDRYGGLVFSSIGYTKPWDGTQNNKPVPAGTYYYLIDLKNGKRYSGWVLVVR